MNDMAHGASTNFPRKTAGTRPDEASHEVTVWMPENYRALMAQAGRTVEAPADDDGEILWMGYGRYSTNEQDPDSLVRQKTNCEPHWSKPGHRLHNFFTDSGRSGTTMHGRKGLEAFMAAIRVPRPGKKVRAVVEDVDRLARNVGHLLLMFEEMRQLGVELWDCRRGKLSWLDVWSLGMIAQLGRDRIVSLTSDGRRMAIRRGRVMGRVIAGYMYDKGKRKVRVIDPDWVEAIKWTFERIAAGATCWQVAKDLCVKYPLLRKATRLGLPAYDEKFVRRMVTNPLYMGLSLYDRETEVRDFSTRKVTGKRANPLGQQIMVEVEHLRIVERPLWALANAALAERAPGVGGGGARVGPLSGRVRCGCGAPMKRHGPPDRKTFQCTSHVNASHDRCTVEGGHRIDRVEAVVLDRIAALLDDADDARLRLHVERVARQEADAARRERAALVARREAIHREEKRLWDASEIVGFSNDQLSRMRTALAEEAQEVEDRLSLAPAPSSFHDAVDGLKGASAAIAAMRARLPFKAESAEDQGFVSALRAIVREVVLSPGAEPGVTLARLRLCVGDAEPMDDVAEEENPQLSFLFEEEAEGGSDDFVDEFEFTREDGARVDPRIVAREARAAEMEALAAQGVHDVKRRVWEVAAPLLKGVDFGKGDEAIQPRRAVDAIVFALRTGTDWKALPATFGDPGAFYRLLKRMARSGALDQLLEALQEETPWALEGADLSRLSTTRFPRSDAAIAPGRGDGTVELGPSHQAELLAAADAELNDQARMRMLVVAWRAATVDVADVAETFGISTIYVTKLTSAYRAGGLGALRARGYRKPPSVFTQAVFSQLAAFVAQGFDPDAPHRPLTLSRVNAYAKEIGVDVTIQHLGRKLNDAGVSLQAAIAAARLARLDGTPSDSGRSPGSKAAVEAIAERAALSVPRYGEAA